MFLSLYIVTDENKHSIPLSFSRPDFLELIVFVVCYRSLAPLRPSV